MRRRIVLGAALAIPVALTGCGWEPLYADRESSPGDEQLRAIQVAPIPERIGQRLTLALRDALNPGGGPTPKRYVLRIVLQTVRQDLGVLVQGLATRGRLDVNANIVLSDAATGVQLLATGSHVAESFDIVANEYSALVAEEDARIRAVEELRRDIVTRLTLFMQRRVAEQAKAGKP